MDSKLHLPRLAKAKFRLGLEKWNFYSVHSLHRLICPSGEEKNDFKTMLQAGNLARQQVV
jgi:hypothetical protein